MYYHILIYFRQSNTQLLSTVYYYNDISNDACSLNSAYTEPGQPQDFIVVNRTSSSAYFTWTPPLLTNGVVSHYSLLCSPEDTDIPEADELRRYDVPFYELQFQQNVTISGLLESTAYNCRLRASNEAGVGPAAVTSFTTLKLNLDIP